MSIPRIPQLREAFSKVGLEAIFRFFDQDFHNWLKSWIHPSAAFKPQNLTDATAENNSIYYSTTAGKLVFKDSVGAVHNLY